ncbi:MAG: hypothetical protein ACTHNK_19440 [Thermomicrobiales bacterium]
MVTGTSDSSEVAGWVVATAEQLRIACALLGRASGGIGSLEMLIDTGSGPQPVEWLAFRRHAADLARVYGVEVTATRLAHGVLVRVAARHESCQLGTASGGVSAIACAARLAGWQQLWWALPVGLLLLALWVARL